MAEVLPSARLAWTWGAAAAALAFALDQATKWWVLAHLMDPPRVIPITPFFNLVLGWNRGVSFGLLSADHPATPWLLSSLALAVVVGLVVWTTRDRRPGMAASVGFIVGGALGNVVDRLRHGAVTDFLDFHVAGYHWPAFNLADTAIFVGVALLLLVGGRRDPAGAPTSAARP
ncbi:lipoprotein signal peptidase [Roseomonas sp. TAS13]|jgi:signal peptidase II|uniref:Lipoprotein signal peptidase n=2 Tax=Muricoccus TaxID=3409995 RepID=A0A840YLE1_9PROT|nr:MULTISPECIES: signal peptidase II [Roseomonas]MBB5695912.1 signal peptidase II [Roseomonas pecuniae]USQ74603.1 signal peptidase II [Roseomonas mucosa]GAV34425.1 lipoprotein signal peptidase [Roseomonas sp. TAS13]SHK47549.1 signal peptidase II [Roseomonas rosea]